MKVKDIVTFLSKIPEPLGKAKFLLLTNLEFFSIYIFSIFFNLYILESYLLF